MADGEDDQLLSARTDLMKSVGDLAEHLDGRLRTIYEAMETAAAHDEGRSRLFEDIWRPKLDGLAQSIEEFRRRAATNPTLCVMGKRGQGKTSLLSTWLAGSISGGGSSTPLADVLKLPTGASDTTAALVRLRAVRPGDTAYDPRFLYCAMLENVHSDQDLSLVPAENRPRAPDQKSIRVRRDGLPAYWVCRFPNEETDKNHRLVVDSAGDAAVKQDSSGRSLEEVQWHTREVVMPIDISSAPADDLGSKTLGVLDVIDAPGADAQWQAAEQPDRPSFADWKRRKNGVVFRAAIRELDVLLLIASCDKSAIQLGGQFQEDIWWKWLERCREDQDLSGRLVLAFTKSVQLFNEAANRLDSRDAETNEINDFATLIGKNILEALAAHPKGVPQLLRAKDPSTWPPMFFFEKDDASMARYREGIRPGDATTLSERILSQLFAGSADPSEDLPLGGRCVFLMASDILASERVQSIAGRRAVARWIVGKLCRLLDPADKGYVALTDLVHDYATGGPVARNHAGERAQDASRFCEQFRAMLGDLATPARNQKALHDVESARALVEKYWAEYPEGPRLYAGQRCKDRRSQISDNGSILGTRKHSINHAMVLEDVARDAVDQLRGPKHQWTREEVDIVARVLHACLRNDVALRGMAGRTSQAIDRDKESLLRIQAVALERTVRVLDYLVHADKSALALIASHCFQIDLNEAALVGELPPDVVQWTGVDDSKLAAVAASHAKLVDVIDRIPWTKPYANDPA